MTTATNHDYKTKTNYIVEDPEVITARKALAEFHMSQGKSMKYSWWLAFQQYPRDTLPSQTSSTPEAPSRDSETS